MNIKLKYLIQVGTVLYVEGHITVCVRADDVFGFVKIPSVKNFPFKNLSYDEFTANDPITNAALNAICDTSAEMEKYAKRENLKVYGISFYSRVFYDKKEQIILPIHNLELGGVSQNRPVLFDFIKCGLYATKNSTVIKSLTATDLNTTLMMFFSVLYSKQETTNFAKVLPPLFPKINQENNSLLQRFKNVPLEVDQIIKNAFDMEALSKIKDVKLKDALEKLMAETVNIGIKNNEFRLEQTYINKLGTTFKEEFTDGDKIIKLPVAVHKQRKYQQVYTTDREIGWRAESGLVYTELAFMLDILDEFSYRPLIDVIPIKIEEIPEINFTDKPTKSKAKKDNSTPVIDDDEMDFDALIDAGLDELSAEDLIDQGLDELI